MMSDSTWNKIAQVCDANHDLYAAAFDGHIEQAEQALRLGAEPSRVIAWVGDDINALRFLLDCADYGCVNSVTEMIETIDKRGDVDQLRTRYVLEALLARASVH